MPARVQTVARAPLRFEPTRIHDVNAQRPNGNLDIAKPLVLDFKKISMSDELPELLRLLPSDGKLAPPGSKR
jgi:hypothetical protein